ncbi:tRNA pseudouridine synthase A [Tessaracoccus antarcticus]|uniref:tRNA pseudouridine synthase A n=1 Tax=Tessaracoccus antarcticus TaxID=2479848 RepID=A0A3M0G0P2_9ACTN|nr:tRNA pseudouridine synthase A [Tessaracoccus antarcticus]RMB58325.1 tRNA pseudouridine(38-40) synthase TruA [Tessaracoccus antarcticus]
MMRWRLDIAYDGTDFRGWATQPGHRTVQEVLEFHITRVLRLPQPARLVVAGRTDAAVHARGQVCHLDVPFLSGDGNPSPAELHRLLGRVLPKDVVVRAVVEAPEGFDARFSAIWRRYCYRIIDSQHIPDPLHRRHVVAVRHPVDVDVLNAAAPDLMGLRDFAAFCKPRDGATTIRELSELSATQRPDGVIEIHLLADAFCRSMVRSVVGALIAVGGGRRDRVWLADVASHPQRHHHILVMPGHGLTLEEVGYPTDDGLAARAQLARSRRTLEDS